MIYFKPTTDDKKEAMKTIKICRDLKLSILANINAKTFKLEDIPFASEESQQIGILYPGNWSVLTVIYITEQRTRVSDHKFVVAVRENRTKTLEGDKPDIVNNTKIIREAIEPSLTYDEMCIAIRIKKRYTTADPLNQVKVKLEIVVLAALPT